jgi:hypothetical protein
MNQEEKKSGPNFNELEKETNTEMITTTRVKAIAWFLVGQETCFSSPCVSFRYVIRLIFLNLAW